MTSAKALDTAKHKKKRLRPIEARTFDQICSLPRDGYQTKHFWISISPGRIAFYEQMTGHPSTKNLDIPRAEFDKLVRWYVNGWIGK